MSVRTTFAGIAVAFCALLFLQLARADDAALEQQLKSDYAGKILTLRHFYAGEHLKFRPDGTLQADAPIGPWTIDGRIAVEEVHVSGRSLSIKGRRVNVTFDSQLKAQDQLTTIDDYYGKDREDLGKTLRGRNTEIEIELPRENPDQKDVSSAMHAVFLGDSESMMDIVPEFWRAYFAKQEGKSYSTPVRDRPVYFVKKGVVTPPKVLSDPEPEFSKEARQVKYEGTMFVSLILDEAGSVQELQITKPLGLGLDENAIATVHTWKFEPAQKDGKPVAVKLMIEVNFHLY
jgi:TonB family protein